MTGGQGGPDSPSISVSLPCRLARVPHQACCQSAFCPTLPPCSWLFCLEIMHVYANIHIKTSHLDVYWYGMTKNNFLAGNYNSVSFYQQLIFSLKSPGMQDTNDVPPLLKYNKCTHQRGDFCFISFMGSIHYLGFWKKDWLNCYIQEIKNVAYCDLPSSTKQDGKEIMKYKRRNKSSFGKNWIAKKK